VVWYLLFHPHRTSEGRKGEILGKKKPYGREKRKKKKMGVGQGWTTASARSSRVVEKGNKKKLYWGGEGEKKGERRGPWHTEGAFLNGWLNERHQKEKREREKGQKKSLQVGKTGRPTWGRFRFTFRWPDGTTWEKKKRHTTCQRKGKKKERTGRCTQWFSFFSMIERRSYDREEKKKKTKRIVNQTEGKKKKKTKSGCHRLDLFVPAQEIWEGKNKL